MCCPCNLFRGIERTLSKLVADAKLSGEICLRKEISRRTWWPWVVVLIQLKKAKCKILHLGWGNPQCLYRLVDAQIESSQTEKYSRTSVNEKLYMSQQWALGNLERQSFPGLHQKKLDGQDEGCFVLVRCYTEYGIHLWCPQYPWECTKGGLRKWSEGWNMSLTKLGWESWGCSAWRRLWMLSKNKGGLAR